MNVMNVGSIYFKGVRRFFLFTVLVVLFVSCASEVQVPSVVNVQSVDDLSNATVNSLVYTLPVTVIRVEIEAEKTISKVGPFYRYSKKLLNVNGVIMEDGEEWSLKGVKLYTIGKPDYSKRFSVTSSGSNIASLLNLSPEGVLVGVNLDNQQEQSSSLKSSIEPKIPTTDDVTFDDVPMLKKPLSKTSTAAMAEETANMIYKIRKRRLKILASDYPVLPPDGKAYEVTVSELNKLEKKMVELFVGKKELYSVSKTFDFIPDSMSVNNAVLCRFSSQKGILNADDLSGTPIYIEINIDKPKALPSGVVAIDDKEPLKQGLFYSVPVKGEVKIVDRNVLLLEKEVLLGQYGQLLSMPVELLQKDNIRIELDPVTGALKKIKKESDNSEE